MTIVIATLFVMFYGLSCIGFYKELDLMFLQSEENYDLRFQAGYKLVIGFCAFIWPAILLPALVWKGVSKE